MNIAGEYTFDAPRQLVWDALQDPLVLASVLPGCEKLEAIGETEYKGGLNIKIGPVQGKYDGNVKLEDVDPPNGYTMKVDGKGAQGFVNGVGHLKLSEQGDKTHMVYSGTAQVGGRIASVGQRLIESSSKAIIRQALEGLNTVMKLRFEAMNAALAASSAASAATTAVSAAVSTATATATSVQDIVQNTVQHGTDALENAAQTASTVATAATAQVVDVAAAAREAARKAAAAVPLPQVQPPSQTEFALNVAKEVAKDLIPKPVLYGVIALVIVIILYFLLR